MLQVLLRATAQHMVGCNFDAETLDEVQSTLEEVCTCLKLI